MNETAKLHVWIKTKNDTRNTASSTARADVPKKIAYRLAVEINEYGNSGAGEFLERFNLRDGCKLAIGHGVTISYKSRYTRNVTS